MNEASMRARLREYGALTLQGIRHVVPDKEPRRYLYDLVLDYPGRGGKGFRPGLCIATCRAYGGKIRDAQLSAITLELLHNAFLIHDDVEDESYNRRNGPSMHVQTNKAIAINVGDAMNALGLRPLMSNIKRLGNKVAIKVFHEVEHMVIESAEGQAMELGWRYENNCDLEEADYLRMILKKTCWYTCMHPIRIGAIIGTRGVINPDIFNRLGYFMGAAFQIQDDILNLVADEQEYGKEIGGDIIEGKRTLMLIHLMSVCNDKEKALLHNFLATAIPDRDRDTARLILDLMYRYKSIEHAKNTSRYLAGGALKEFYTHFSKLPESEDKAFLESIILYMINRTY